MCGGAAAREPVHSGSRPNPALLPCPARRPPRPTRGGPLCAAQVWELQTAKNANSSSWLTSVLSGTEASLSTATRAIQARAAPEAAPPPRPSA